MRRQILTALLLGFFAFTSMNAYAGCPSVYGPYCLYPSCWYVYDFDNTCYFTDWGAAAYYDTNGNCNYPWWDFAQGNTRLRVVHTLASSDPIMNPDRWNISMWIYANSPAYNPLDTLNIYVIVLHPDRTSNRYNVYSWTGQQGLVSCAEPAVYFSANTGDTIQIVTDVSRTYAGMIHVGLAKITQNSV